MRLGTGRHAGYWAVADRVASAQRGPRVTAFACWPEASLPCSRGRGCVWRAPRRRTCWQRSGGRRICGTGARHVLPVGIVPVPELRAVGPGLGNRTTLHLWSLP